MKFVCKTFLFVQLSFYSINVFAQPDYVFKNAVLLSGNNLHAGAKYKFPEVKPGIDAIITINNIVGGITLTAIDDHATGFNEAFQPIINIPSGSNGYIEFQIDFVGTNTATLVRQENIPVTFLNVDGKEFGDGKLFEEDQVEYFTGTYDYNRISLNQQILISAGWLTIKNTTAKSYNNPDSSAKDVMVTVVNNNITGLKIRLGAKNTSPATSEVRPQSVYFKKFDYPKSILLPTRTLLGFKAQEKNNGVELQGVLAASHTFDKMIIERGTINSQFEYIATLDIPSNSAAFPFTFFDNSPTKTINYYRIRLINTGQNIFEYSNIISVNRLGGNNTKDITIVNSLVNQSNPLIGLYSLMEEEVFMQIADLNGRVRYVKNLRIKNGGTTIDLSGLGVKMGYYILAIKTNSSMISQKIIIK